jgi:glycerol kinase
MAIELLNQHQIACLLLEGIIFRIALILEEFNQYAEIQCVFMSGGLSSLPCLQQGIAMLSPAPTHKIIQEHSGLMGVAILTQNRPAASFRQSEVIRPLNHCALIDKYQRWKVWFKRQLDLPVQG